MFIAPTPQKKHASRLRTTAAACCSEHRSQTNVFILHLIGSSLPRMGGQYEAITPSFLMLFTHVRSSFASSPLSFESQDVRQPPRAPRSVCLHPSATPTATAPTPGTPARSCRPKSTICSKLGGASWGGAAVGRGLGPFRGKADIRWSSAPCGVR